MCLTRGRLQQSVALYSCVRQYAGNSKLWFLNCLTKYEPAFHICSLYWGHELHLLGEPKLHNSALGAVLVWHVIVYVKEQFGRRREKGTVTRRPMNLQHYLQGTAHAAILMDWPSSSPFSLCSCRAIGASSFSSSIGSNSVFVCLRGRGNCQESRDYLCLFICFYLFSNATGSMTVSRRGGLQWICNNKYS